MNKITIVGFGDSLTYGYGVSYGTSYIDKLKTTLPSEYQNYNWRVVNSGINGNTTREGISRLEYDVLAYSPDLVFILFGSNDSALNDKRLFAVCP